MAQMYNPVTGKTYSSEAIKKTKAERPSPRLVTKEEAAEIEKKNTSFTRRHPRLANACLILGVMTAMCTMAIGLHELSSGKRVEFIDTSPISRNVSDHRGFFANTFCRGGHRSQFCN